MNSYIESFFGRVDEELWRTVKSQYPKSKVRAGHVFAEQVDLTNHPTRCAELADIWAEIKAVLTNTTSDKRL